MEGWPVPPLHGLHPEHRESELNSQKKTQMRNQMLAEILKEMAKAEGDEAMAVALEAWRISKEAQIRADLFGKIGHIMYSKAVGCPTHQGECEFHEKRFDKLPREDWEKRLA